MTDEHLASINVSISAAMRARFNMFVAWMNSRHPASDLGTGKRSMWTQNEAMELVLENSEMWQEFVTEEEAVEQWHEKK